MNSFDTTAAALQNTSLPKPMLEITLEEALELVEAARESGTIFHEIRTVGMAYVHIQDEQGQRVVAVNELHSVGSLVVTLH